FSKHRTKKFKYLIAWLHRIGLKSPIDSASGQQRPSQLTDRRRPLQVSPEAPKYPPDPVLCQTLLNSTSSGDHNMW
ncbi:MAG: hypothetical protein WBN68_01665, partial [Sedimenticolaceae bacterium]